MQEEFENVDSLNDTMGSDDFEVTDDTETNEQHESESANEEHDVDWYKQQNAKLFARAKKAEGFTQVNGQWVKKEATKVETQTEAKVEPKADLTSMDTIALINAKVTEQEDIEEVLDYARFKKITVAEALKASAVKTILKEKAELRATAEATNTGGSRRGSNKPSAEALLEKASKGQMPDDPEELARARMEALKNK